MGDSTPTPTIHPNDETEASENVETESSRFYSDEESSQEEFEDQPDNARGQEFNNKRIVLRRFTIYNSKSTMYIVGSNAKESLFRILEIVKDPDDETNIEIIEDKSYFYTRKDMIELINGLNESVEGGIYKNAHGYGLLGLIRFTKGYYLSLITKCNQVAVLGGHYIYHIDETKLIPLDINYRRPEKYSDEEKLISTFKYLDLGKTFYFSYSYDITNSLQTNFIRQKKHAENYHLKKPSNTGQFDTFEHNERFVWNNLLLEPVLKQDVATYEWFQPIIQGFVDQANISVYGKIIYITIIARRSHHFAGARFLKRGVNDRGNVANEVETEQIVSDMLITSFHDPKYGFYGNPRFTSFVQHRGSIPLFWTQDLNKLPKPPIEINLSDPFYQSSAIHFNNLFERYWSPIIVLNLIKVKEKVPRESKLNVHFVNCINYLNQFLPEEHKIIMHSFDMSKHSKKNMDVIGPLQNIASESINKIGFFHNGPDLASTKIQKGIIRTNCIDCLDRTNAAQFIIFKEALYHQLSSLGIISKSTSLDYDSDLINIMTEIFHDHGDTIAVQYGGSNLVNTMDSYRRINQWSSHTRDMLNSIKRIYSNSFMDSIRQEAINIFLGNYIYDPNKPKLWELQNDYYLHNTASILDVRVRRSYMHWFNENNLKQERFQLVNPEAQKKSKDKNYNEYKHLEPYPDFNDNWFNECYVPSKYQSFAELFQFNMNSNIRYFPSNIGGSSKHFDYSPFETRKPTIQTSKPGEPMSVSGNNNVKYLENEELRGDSNETIEEIGDDENCSSFVKDNLYVPEMTRKFRVSSTNYLSNSKKFKSFLTDKIEKLAYSTKNVQTSPKESPQFSYSSPIFDVLSLESKDSELNNADVSLSDDHLYKTQLSLNFFTENSNKYEPRSLDINDDDQRVYRYYTKKLIHSDDTLYEEPLKYISESDGIIYRKYLGMNDFDLKTQDNYFY